MPSLPLFPVVVFGFAGVIAYSEYRASGYNDAQNLTFAMLASVVVPYRLYKNQVFDLYGRRSGFQPVFGRSRRPKAGPMENFSENQ